LKIREITSYSDSIYNAIVVMLPQLGPETHIPSKDELKVILESQTTHFFVIENESDIIAGILTLCIYSIPSGTKAVIEDVVVDESSRGKGYGEALMRFALEYAGSKGAGAVDLTSRPSRVAANRLYHKLGFVLRKTNVYRYYFS
jgi:ribosomal protein S18 acetylase RimI-like enzyme